MQIVNESDRDVTWWCYNSEDWGREHTSPGGRGDLAQGGRASFNPPNNATGLYYVVFTDKGGSLTYAWWRPANASTLKHSPKLGRDQTVTLRGSSRYEAVNRGDAPSKPGVIHVKTSYVRVEMQIVNESDMHITWWCYNSNDEVREVTVDWGKGTGDLAPGARVSYKPPGNQTGYYYVQFTRLHGHLPSFWWKAANQYTYARLPTVAGNADLVYRGSTSFEAIVT